MGHDIGPFEGSMLTPPKRPRLSETKEKTPGSDIELFRPRTEFVRSPAVSSETPSPLCAPPLPPTPDPMVPFDPSLCPEVSAVARSLEELRLEDGPAVGDAVQEEAIAHAVGGGSMFLTGKAGTGKSWTTRRIVAALGRAGRVIHTTAPTGIAAINVGGVTINSWGGFGTGEYYADFDRMMRSETREKVSKTDALLVDEISMLSGHLFDVLECMVTIIRNYDKVGGRGGRLAEIKERAPVISEAEGGYSEADNSNQKSIMSLYMLQMRWKDQAEGGLADLPPWGGMQMIVVGDFFQLPPVPNARARSEKGGAPALLHNDELWETEYNLVVGRQGFYAFQSHAWDRSRFRTVDLDTVHRQRAEDAGVNGGLLGLLNDMREGRLPLRQELDPVLRALKAPLRVRDDGIVPTELHAMNVDVDQRNGEELEKIDGKECRFEAKDDVELDTVYKNKLVRKYELKELSSMPYLWACVEKPAYPERWKQVREEMEAMEEKKKRLLKDENYEELIPLRTQQQHLEKEKNTIELDVKTKSTITASTIADYLNERKITLSPDIVLHKCKAFQRQLKTDFKTLQEHAQKRFFEKDCRVGKEIVLKAGAQVMLLYNLDLLLKLANGSRGIVLCCVPVSEYRKCLLEVMASRVEVRKNTGTGKEGGCDQVVKPGQCTETQRTRNNLENLTTDIKPAAAHSGNNTDVNSGEGISSSDTNTASITERVKLSLEPNLAKKVLGVIERMSTEELQKEQRKVDVAEASNLKEFPLVQFREGQVRVITFQLFDKEFKGCGTAKRWQIPLSLAWAITIHKSQGMTIDWLRVNLGACFSPGQAYVACSRGRDVDSIVVEQFSEYQIKTSEVVKRFYAQMHERGADYHPPTWMESLANFEESAASEARLRESMMRCHGERTCQLCGSLCRVNIVRKKTANRGKWFVSCPRGYRNGHTWEWVVALPM